MYVSVVVKYYPMSTLRNVRNVISAIPDIRREKMTNRLTDAQRQWDNMSALTPLLNSKYISKVVDKIPLLPSVNTPCHRCKKPTRSHVYQGKVYCHPCYLNLQKEEEE